MSSEFEYKPRFKDMRIKPPRPEEVAAEADVLHLKPGEVCCQWPDCRKPATARAPKSRERLNDFYDFCQGHAGEYNLNTKSNVLQSICPSHTHQYRNIL
jgi:hypothetical protein